MGWVAQYLKTAHLPQTVCLQLGKRRFIRFCRSRESGNPVKSSILIPAFAGMTINLHFLNIPFRAWDNDLNSLTLYTHPLMNQLASGITECHDSLIPSPSSLNNPSCHRKMLPRSNWQVVGKNGLSSRFPIHPAIAQAIYPNVRGEIVQDRRGKRELHCQVQAYRRQHRKRQRYGTSLQYWIRYSFPGI